MKQGRVLLALGAGFAGFVTHCVGDDSTTKDAGNDVTTDVGTNDVSTDVEPGDAGQDADASGNGKHAYVAGFSGALFVYDLPLSATSTPSVVLKANFNQPSDVEILPSATQLIVVDGAAKKLSIFDLPITAASVATTTISVDFAAIDGAFDSAGNFWVCGVGNKLEKFTAPFSASSTAQTFTLPTNDGFAIAIAPNGNMFIGTTGHIYGLPFVPDAGVVTPTVDNTNTATPTGIALNNGLFVSNINSGVVDQYGTPFNSNTAFTAVGGALLSMPARLKFAANGSLGVADANKGIVVLTAPGFTTGFTVAPNPDAGVVNMRGITFGP